MNNISKSRIFKQDIPGDIIRMALPPDFGDIKDFKSFPMKQFKKCKSATFNLDGVLYTIGKDIGCIASQNNCVLLFVSY